MLPLQSCPLLREILDIVMITEADTCRLYVLPKLDEAGSKNCSRHSATSPAKGRVIIRRLRFAPMSKRQKPPLQLTTAQQLSSIIKSARDIMREDKGLNGDLDRLPMLTWILFLKLLDDSERMREEKAKMKGERFRPTIQPPYRWRDWAAREDGITGDELREFINNDKITKPDGGQMPGLFAYLRSLQAEDAHDPRRTIATVFKDVNNRMLSGYLLRDVVYLLANLQSRYKEPIGQGRLRAPATGATG